MEIVSPELTPRQKEIVKSVLTDARQVSVICTSRQFGKTTMIKTLLLYFALNNPKVNIGVFTPTYTLGNAIFDDLIEWLDVLDEPICDKNIAKLSIKFNNKSRIKFFSTERPTGSRGSTFDYIFIDEAAFIDSDAYYSVISAMFLIKGVKMLICSTPLTKDNWFYREAMNPTNNYQWANYLSNPLANVAWVEKMRLSMPNWKFRAEYLGEWLDSELSVFTNINSVCTETIVLNSVEKTYAGLDIGLKNDFTVLTIYDKSGTVLNCLRFTDCSTNLFIAKINQAILDYNIAYMTVEENFESTLIELLRKDNSKVYIEGFRTTNKSKLEIIESLIVAFDFKKIKHLNLEYVTEEFNSFIKVSIPSGYTYKADKGKHDDVVMSSALGYHCWLENNRKSSLKARNY